MAKMNKHIVTIFVPVIVVVILAVIVGAVVIAASGNGPMHNVPPQYAAASTEPHAGDAQEQVTAQASETMAAPEPEMPSCDFSSLVGQPLTSLDVSAYVPRAVRILHPGAMATMDYSPSRINIHVDDKEMITQVTCG